MEVLRIHNFKCFEEIDIDINAITVMAGANGNGKSTAIQALLFFRQTVENSFKIFEGYYINGRENFNNKIPLNGNYLLSLGNSSYVINRNANKEHIKISLGHDDKEDIAISYTANNFEPELYLTADKCSTLTAGIYPVLKKEFYYLNAERIGPRLNQKIQFFDYPNAGWQGEYVAHLIAERGGYVPVDKERLFPETSNPGLEHQVNEWLNYIMPGVRVTVKNSPDTFTAQIQIENAYTKGDPTLATNIGFGISYILPIIATGLIAQKGSYFIVENPEAHLHPSAQSKIGRFLAMVANAGVSVIVETHSDHIINGIQIAVAEKVISNDLVSVNFFGGDVIGTQPEVIHISIKEKGELSQWPKGFFDQSQIDYSYLIQLRKNV